MEVIGRKKERQLLELLLQKDASQFVAVYGRRRIGKTFLIRNVYAKQLVFECAGLYQGSKEHLLEHFWIQLSKKSKQQKVPAKTWLAAFDQLTEYINELSDHEGKKIIFLDEISWFDTAKSGFLGALSNFWNAYCTKRKDIVLIICGSAASWIINKVINARGGLHNRLDRIIRLDPFTLAETKSFFENQKINLSLYDVTQVYMCLGGVPFYLNQIEKGKSVLQIFDQLFFTKNGILQNEFGNLYAALFRNHESHVKVIKALSSKNKGLTRSEIMKFTKRNSGGGLTQILDELEQCGFIQKFSDFNKPKEDGLFRLVDEFTLFYLKFLSNTQGKSLAAQDLINSNSFKIWSGFAFENLCIKHLPQITKTLGISGVSFNAHSFLVKATKQYTGAQIDLIIDRADNCVNLIEIKYSRDKYFLTKKEQSLINLRIDSFEQKSQSKKTIFVTLISPFGAIKNEYFLSTITNELVLEDLMND